MLSVLKKLQQDEHGVILSAEIVVVGTLLVVGAITGLTCLRQSVEGELRDMGAAVGALDQSYAFSSHRKAGFHGRCCAYTAGSSFMNCESGVNETNLQTEDTARLSGSDCCKNAVVPQTKAEPCQSATESAVPQCGHCDACRQGNACQQSHIGRDGVRAFSAGNAFERQIETDVPNLRISEWSAPEGCSGCSDSTSILQPVPGQMNANCCLGGSSGSSSDLIIPEHVW